MDPTHLIEQIIASAHDVRRALKGRDLADRFERALVPALAVRGVRVTADRREPVEYRGGGLTAGYHVDLRVAGCPLVVELKVLDGLHAADDDQMLNRLRLGVWQRGAINLNVTVTNRGVRCDVFDLRHLAPPPRRAARARARTDRRADARRRPCARPGSALTAARSAGAACGHTESQP